MRLACCPGDATLLATTYHTNLVLWRLPELEDGDGFAFVCEGEDLPASAINLTAGCEEELTCIAFSLDGQRLCCGDRDGKVRHEGLFVFLYYLLTVSVHVRL